ncbi:MAG: hypothetical protein ACLUFN_01195 [Eubacterium sp.]
MEKLQYVKPLSEIENFTMVFNVITTSGGILDNNTDVEIPDDFFTD